MKDIAVYKLSIIEAALSRLGDAVLRLEEAVGDRFAGAAETDQDAAQLEADLAALRQDYERLKGVAATVAIRLDTAIDRLRGDGAGA